MPTSSAERDLQVIARDFVDRTSGASYALVSLFGETSVREQRFAPRVQREGVAQVNGRNAYYVTFEVVDVDRLRAQPEARGEMLTLIFVRPGEHRWLTGVTSGLELPMVVLFGLASRPEHHEQHREAFASLVSRVDVGISTGGPASN